ncbi:MAG: hypothetical protein EZS28_004599 [Streblomastix strix]|uniref:Uncharacterized protein n=1 Tax=Streblomastix strix TaxID=222440 RepID=A0A5J4WXR6_9EUKA|nr:MAG: hypothetical protein EZS28_004599 [Streblomastix strix]
MSPKQTGSMKTAVPTRGSPRKVDVNGHVVPIATAERSLIPRQKDAIRPSGPSWNQKGPLFDLTVATDQSMVYSIIICITDAELNRSCHCNGVHGIVLVQSTSKIFAIYGYSGIRLQGLRSGNEHVRIEVSNVEHNCVSSVSTFQNSPAIVSGVSKSQVRLWKLSLDSQLIVATMKEHRIAVTAVRVTQEDLECTNYRSDGQMRTQV